MATIGVRELKQRTSQVLRRVRERGEEIEVTHEALLRLPSLRLLDLDETLARAAAAVAARLGGADAVSIAAAARLRLPLVTWDVEQRDGAARVVPVLVPEP